MRVWVRQSGNSPDDRIRFYNALAAGVVTVGIVSSLTLATPIHNLLRKTHLVSTEFQAPPASALALAMEPAGAASDMSVASLEPATMPAIAPPRAPLPIPRPQVTEQVALPKPRPNLPPAMELASAGQENTARRSRHQVERNVRNQQRLHDAVDAAVAGGADFRTLIAEARRHLGTNPTTRARLWCARFMNFVLQRTGYRGTGSDLAMSFAKYGHQISRPRVGAIAVMRRKDGGHVGIVTAVPGKGRIVLLSGNDGRRVRERVRSTRNVVAYVIPQRGSSSEHADLR